MRKFWGILLLATAAAMAATAVEPRARVDIDGRVNQVGLKMVGKPVGGVAGNALWAGPNQPYYLVTQGPAITWQDWRPYTFSFVADKDGDVTLRFAGYYYRPRGEPRNIPVWTAYDEIEVTGAILLNGNFEEVGYDGKPDGWELGDLSQYVRKNGRRYIRVWHNAPAVQKLWVTAGQTVTIRAMTSGCENLIGL